MSSKGALSKFWDKLRGRRVAGYLFALVGITIITAILEPISLKISHTTVALALLMAVLFTATLWGSRPALLASVLGVLCFNFFFLPPVGTWTISDPENWFALAAFLVTAVTAGQLSARAKRRAEEAESGRIEIERLYRELSDAFERASHAEALKRSEKLKSALLDAVTHDIRTPLTSIKASVTILLDEQKELSSEELPLILDAETRRDMLEVINEESDRLNSFVEDLIELARIEAGELHLQKRQENVEEIVSAAFARLTPLVGEHNIKIDVEKDLPEVRVDSRAVAEVIYNLIDNAVKYSPRGTEIKIQAQHSDDYNVLIAVEDEGLGIPKELRERVFDKFFRAIHQNDTNIHQTSGGTGMGLAIVKGIVEAHGGKIRISETSNGRGTRFEFTMPSAVADKEVKSSGSFGFGAEKSQRKI
jgi:two-component system sensor histidine kinase KdpD